MRDPYPTPKNFTNGLRGRDSKSGCGVGGSANRTPSGVRRSSVIRGALSTAHLSHTVPQYPAGALRVSCRLAVRAGRVLRLSILRSRPALATALLPRKLTGTLFRTLAKILIDTLLNATDSRYFNLAIWRQTRR